MANRAMKKGKVLVIAAHEDDEINVAGSVMYSCVQQGYEVYCAFTTNGDYSFEAKTRIHEAVRALHVLGVKNIFFLGYGDTANFYEKGHVFYTEKGVFTSPAGHKETYGTSDFPDYAWLKHQAHSPYDRQHFKADLQKLILDVQADIIFCTDYDVHSDHRATSILFEEAMGDILRRPDNMYYPAVFKGFAYCTSFGAPADFYSVNLRSVPQPQAALDRIIGYSLYEWDRRVRFPIEKANYSVFMRRNAIYKALFEHKSQSAALHAIRIINGDSIFWQRRTDSLSYQADVTATSGQAQKAADFKLLDTTNIDEKRPVFAEYLWTPAESDPEKKLSFQWEKGQVISQVRLFGNVDEQSRVLKWKLSFDTGYTEVFGPLPLHGKVFMASVPVQQDVHSCTIQILDWLGEQYGFAECEFYREEEQKTIIQPFVKLKINDDFVYDYVIDKSHCQIQVEVYTYPTKFPVQFSIVAGTHSQIDDTGLLSIGKEDDVIQIRATAGMDASIFDEVTVRRVSSIFIWKRIVLQRMEKWLLTWYLKRHRKYIHIQHKYLKKL